MSDLKVTRKPDWCWIVLTVVLLVLLFCAIVVIAVLIWCPSMPPKGGWLSDMIPAARAISQMTLA